MHFIAVIMRVFDKIVNITFSFLSTFIARLSFFFHNVKCGKNLKVSGWINLNISPYAQVIVGNNVRITSGFPFNPVGGSTKTSIFALNGSKLTVCDWAGLSNCVIVCWKEITIGEGTLIGGGVEIYDTDFHPILPEERMQPHDTDKSSRKAIFIGPKSFIGAHSVILKGVTIGEGAIIGAGSVVTKDIPPYQIWAGNPAKFIKQLPGLDS